MPNKNTANQNETALTTTGETALFDASFLPDMTEIQEVMQENMEGIDLKFEKVKIPSGGGIVWEVPNEDGDFDTVKELTGVIIDHHPINAYWKEEYNGENNPPDCSSLNGITSDDGKNCATCPLNQFGSDPKGGKGKACKNMQRVYLVRESEIFPLLIAVPPTSLDNFRQYVRRLTSKLKKVSSVLTKLTLTKDKNDGGIIYSKVEFRRDGNLDKETAFKMGEFAKTMKPYLRKIAITEDEYNTEGAADNNGATVTDAAMDEAFGFGQADAQAQTIDVQGELVNDPAGEAGKAW